MFSSPKNGGGVSFSYAGSNSSTNVGGILLLHVGWGVFLIVPIIVSFFISVPVAIIVTVIIASVNQPSS